MAKIVTEATTLERVAVIKDKKYGKRSFIRGDEAQKRIPRLQTGIFALTYATGNGYPFWRMTRIKGPEHGGKSTTAITAMKMCSMTCWKCLKIKEFCVCPEGPTSMKSVYLDSEGTLDPEWVKAIGVPADEYYMPTAPDGGAYLDLADASLMADDCGVVIIDSVASLLPPMETDRAIGDRQVGSLPKLLTDGAAKLTNRLIEERRRGHRCLIIAINQIRMEIGVGLYQNPESEAGGRAFRHWSALGIRISKLMTKDEKHHGTDDNFAVVQKHGFKIDKDKVWTITKDGDFLRARGDIISESGEVTYRKGDTIEENVIYDYGVKHNIIEDLGTSKHIIKGLMPKGLNKTDLLQLLRINQPLRYQVHKDITNAAWQEYEDRCIR
jgi:RecA/RadA recombinase